MLTVGYKHKGKGKFTLDMLFTLLKLDFTVSLGNDNTVVINNSSEEMVFVVNQDGTFTYIDLYKERTGKERNLWS